MWNKLPYWTKGALIALTIVIIGLGITALILYANYREYLSSIVYEGNYSPPSFAEFIDSRGYSSSGIVFFLSIIPWILGYQSDQSQLVFSIIFWGVLITFLGAMVGFIYGRRNSPK